MCPEAFTTALLLLGQVEPNEGEYMAGWRRDALTVPDRSIAALRHPTWYAGDAFPRPFKQPTLDMMGPHVVYREGKAVHMGPNHPVKSQIEKQVAAVAAEVKALGPIVGAKSAKERLELKEKDEAENGKGLPNWRAADAANRMFNPLVLNKARYLDERETFLAAFPARSDPRLPQIKTKGLGGYFDNDLKLLGSGPMAGK